MPAGYAHYKMGQDVRAELTGQEKEIIEKYPELYLIGLHGPDILFYHKVIKPNKVSGLGFAMHKRPGTEFFTKAAEVIRNSENKEAALSYIYGFICHFAMDVTCHGYVNEKMAQSGIGHTEIESEFDRELLVRDKHDPLRKKLTGHIVPSEENAGIIRVFFSKAGAVEISTENIRKTLKDMIFYCDFLTTASRVKRGIIYTFMRLIGKYEVMHGLMINYEKNPECEDSTERLIALYDEAKELAVRLIEEYKDFVAGSAPLNYIYHYSFNSVLSETAKDRG